MNHFSYKTIHKQISLKVRRHNKEVYGSLVVALTLSVSYPIEII